MRRRVQRYSDGRGSVGCAKAELIDGSRLMRAGQPKFIPGTVDRDMFFVEWSEPFTKRLNVLLATDVPEIVERKVGMQPRSVPVTCDRLWMEGRNQIIFLRNQVQKEMY